MTGKKFGNVDLIAFGINRMLGYAAIPWDKVSDDPAALIALDIEAPVVDDYLRTLHNIAERIISVHGPKEGPRLFSTLAKNRAKLTATYLRGELKLFDKVLNAACTAGQTIFESPPDRSKLN